MSPLPNEITKAPYKQKKGNDTSLSGHSLFNIMYEKKISYSQGEVYEL